MMFKEVKERNLLLMSLHAETVESIVNDKKTYFSSYNGQKSTKYMFYIDFGGVLAM